MTQEGRYLGVMILTIGFGAVSTGNHVLYLLLSVQLAMIIASGILSELTLERLEVRRLLPAEIFASTPFLVGVHLQNNKRWFPSFSVQIEDNLEGSAVTKRCYFLKVPAGSNQRTNYRFEVARRGVYRFEEIKVGTRFPFAFFLKVHAHPLPSQIVVLPQIYDLSRFDLEQLETLHKNLYQINSYEEDYHLLREYKPRDPARLIHWRTSAKKGKLFLREEQILSKGSVCLLLDHSIPHGFDILARSKELDRCIDIAASLLFYLWERFDLMFSIKGQNIKVTESSLNQGLNLLALVQFYKVNQNSISDQVKAIEHHFIVVVAHSESQSHYKNLNHADSICLIDESFLP